MPTPPLSNADAWDALTKAGVQPDSATAIVKGRDSMAPADLWDRLTANGARPDDATSLVSAMHPGATPKAQPSLPAGYAPGAGESALVHGLDAPTFGLGMKAAAGIGHLVTGAPYDAIRASQQAAVAKQANDHPIASAAGTVAGALANPLNFALPGVGGAESVAGAAGRSAVQGGAFGAADAAGHSEGDIGDRLKATALGAVTGAGTAGLLGAGMAGVKGALSNAFSPTSQIMKAINESGGPDALRAVLDKFKAAGKDGVVALGHLSQPLRDLADNASTMSDKARAAIGSMTGSVQDGQGARLLQDAESANGAPLPNAQKVQDAMDDERSQFAAGPQGFGGVRDAGASVDQNKLAAALKAPGIQSALGLVRLGGDVVKGDPIDQLVTRIQADNPNWSASAVRDAAGNGVGASLYGSGGAGASATDKPVTYEEAHQLYQILESKSAAAFKRPGGNPAGWAFSNIKGAVDDALQDVPGHAEAMAGYQQRSAAMRALDAGQTAFNSGTKTSIGNDLAGLSQPEQAAYQQGMQAKLQDWLNAKSANRDVAAEIANGGDTFKAKIAAAFGGDQAKIDQFNQSIAVEKQLSALKGSTAGSATARRTAAIQNVLAGMSGMGLALHSPMAAIGSGVGYATSKGLQAAATSAAGDVGTTLATQGGDAITALLGKLDAASGPALGAAGQGVAAGAGGAAGGLMAR